ncbi:hypothetical protein N7G274_010056 [Stereocaulon virgatum]|uniref:Uncharacterized protein n=1 Tax=Stereocaulon virgatum TaxID=373712 RepID=A0ABR4A1J5_9LECA
MHVYLVGDRREIPSRCAAEFIVFTFTALPSGPLTTTSPYPYPSQTPSIPPITAPHIHHSSAPRSPPPPFPNLHHPPLHREKEPHQHHQRFHQLPIPNQPSTDTRHAEPHADH